MKTSSLFSSLKQGILICDRDSKIIFFNEAYEKYLGIPLSRAKGRIITYFRPNAIAPQVVKDGKAREGIIRHEYEQEYCASIYPITEDDKIIGTISLVTSLELKHDMQKDRKMPLSERVKEFERQEIEITVAAYGGGTRGKRLAAEELGISLATLYNKLK